MLPEREAPALVVSACPLGEVAARVHVLTEAQGLVRGVAPAGTSRAGRALWQPGNVVKTDMRQRGEGSMPNLSGEVLYACAARLLEAPLALALLQSACALLDTSLPEREACPFLFGETLRLLTFLGYDADVAERTGVPLYIRWEQVLLQTLGFGLDLSRCAVTGAQTGLAYVSPRTGRAVSQDGAGPWRDRLLPLPAFLLSEQDDGCLSDWHAGLVLNGHFFERDVYGQRHRPMPAARQRLAARIAAQVERAGTEDEPAR